MTVSSKADNRLAIDALRQAIREEYSVVADHPEQGFHFHTGRPLARLLGYEDAWLSGIPEESLASFAGTGNPFSLGELLPRRTCRGCWLGAGLDSLIAARMVGPYGAGRRR